MKQNNLIFPVTETEQEFLEINPTEFGLNGDTMGAMLSPSRIREGVKRWIKQGCPDPIDGNEVSDVVKATRDVLWLEHNKRIKELRETHDKTKQGFETKVQLYERRIKLKNTHIQHVNQKLNAEKERVHAYRHIYGEGRAHPLNFVQRWIGRLFRIL